MHRLALLFVLFVGLCSPLLAQEPATTRFGINARFVPNGGAGVTASIPEAMISNATIPLQVSPEARWLLTIAPASDGGHVTISVADSAVMRPGSGSSASAPVVIAQGVFPFTFDRPIIVLQTNEYRIEVTLRKL